MSTLPPPPSAPANLYVGRVFGLEGGTQTRIHVCADVRDPYSEGRQDTWPSPITSCEESRSLGRRVDKLIVIHLLLRKPTSCAFLVRIPNM